MADAQPSTDDRAANRDDDDSTEAGKQEQKAQEKRALSAYVLFRALTVEGKEELHRSASSLAWSGLAAGLSISFSVVAEALLTHHLPEAKWTPLVSKLGYSVGFLMVVRGRQQLFTENTLTPVLPLLKERTASMLGKLLRLWAIVLVTNLIGTALFALAMAHLPMFEPGLTETIARMSRGTVDLSFNTIVVRGLFAGWLLALMVWLLPVSESGRISVIVILTYLIGVAHFSHVVAGSTEAFFLAAVGEIGWIESLTHFVVPAFLGNTLGGVTMVAALNYAQAVDQKKEE